MTRTLPTALRRALFPLVAVLFLALLAELGLTTLHALAAAGLVGVAPPNATAFQKLIGTLKDNATWLIATGVALVLTIVAVMLGMGSRNAPDVLFRVAGAIGLVLVVIPATVA